ncbi:MAG: class I SAM-dependent methyltransferase [Rhizobacter sp.]|nr:class I SAM-dependent methyltransferase [Rhizobacter sp.]
MVWPLPALLTWAIAWVVFIGLQHLGAPTGLAMGLALLLAAGSALFGATPWRRVFIGAGFPLSLAVSGLAASLPGWAWLLPLLLLVLLYPMNTWRDAPLFPTPQGALQGLDRQLKLPDAARIVDAGCGLGAGLIELRRVFPRARLFGLEWSWPLRLACALRCRFASVRRADIWAADWSGYDMVYLFQRPESMQAAADKAGAELKAGAWLVSLEFAAPGLVPQAVLEIGSQRKVWAYRAPLRQRR